MGAERAIVRLGIPALLLASCAGAAAVSWHATASQIPSFALLLLVPLVRAIFDGDLPIELSLRGARWSEKLVEVGDELLVRQEKTEEEAIQADLNVKEEVQLLREQQKEVDQAQEDLVDRALERIIALEKAFRTRKPTG
jgi:hypothetical protein